MDPRKEEPNIAVSILHYFVGLLLEAYVQLQTYSELGKPLFQLIGISEKRLLFLANSTNGLLYLRGILVYQDPL